MNPNLEISQSPGYKNILLRKLSYAVTCSVVSQMLVLISYIFLLNFSIFTPIDSFSKFAYTFTSFSTWFYFALFALIIFGQSIICAKDYVVDRRYCSTRFQKFISVFTTHNFLLFNLHIYVGMASVWLFLAFVTKFIKDCNDKYCMGENNFYLLLSGCFTGGFYFTKVYTSEKKIMFPIVQQLKWLQFKASFLGILKKSNKAALLPTISFFILYPIFGYNIKSLFESTTGILISVEARGIYVYFHAWLYSTLVYLYMNLMTFFYKLFLTELLVFPIVSESVDSLTLIASINAKIPIIQHLACLDLYHLAIHSKARRENLFALSQPGNHPHNWNLLIENLLKIIGDYTDTLNKSTSAFLMPEKCAKLPTPIEKASVLTSPMHIRNIRNMSMYEPPVTPIIQKSMTEDTKTENKYLTSLKQRLGINYFFGELPEANIQKCLGDGQIIIWITQALSNLCTASIKEDRYGIVQKDLSIIISSLVELKLSIERLNRVPALTRRGPGLDDFYSKMKQGVLSAVKRSLFNICVHFAPYLRDLNLKKEIVCQLQGYVNNRTL